jgi:OMF family outer membrane factor
MKPVLWCCVVFCFSTVTTAYAAPYTLEELIRAGYENSRSIKSVDEEIVKANAQINEAIGSAFPSIDLSANYQYAFEQYIPFSTDDGIGVPVDSLVDVVDNIDSGAEPGAYELGNAFLDVLSGFSELSYGLKDQSVSLTLTLKQPLFAQGKVGIGLKIARAYKKSLLAKREGVRLDVKSRVTKQYYGALLARKNVTIQEEMVELSGESHRLTRVFFTVGKGTEVDTLRTRLNLEKSMIELQDARSRVKLAFEALIKETGIDERANELELIGDFPDDYYTDSLEEALSKMKRDNRNLHQLKYVEELRELAVSLSKSDFFPSVFCGGSLGKYAQFDAGEKPVWYDDRKVFIGASMNIFNGGMKLQKVHQARADLHAFRFSAEQTAEELELAVKNVFERIETARMRLDTAGLLIELAEKGYDITRKSYEIGMSTLLEFEKAEFELKSARMALNAAKFDYYSAVVDMHELTHSVD